MKGFLQTGIKSECFGCEACVQICPRTALSMKEDSEGFRYPELDAAACIHCGLCNKVCPVENEPEKHEDAQTAFGGYALDDKVRCESTSGGAFSCIVETWWKDGSVIFGAKACGLEVHHSYITDKEELGRFRKSKYSQSHIGNSYAEVRDFLKEGRRVLFSGTPCQIAGLQRFLTVSRADMSRLLTVEVVCEGVPSPYYVRKLNDRITQTRGAAIAEIDYRFTDGKEDYPGSTRWRHRVGRWDFEVMRLELSDGRRLKKDRWFNPFWSIWLGHLMSRPSCYGCPFATRRRLADITLGDLWGVHLYCPELYGKNGGASVMVANTLKGREAMTAASRLMYGHGLEMDDVVRYQGPMRKGISENPGREEFMADLTSESMPLDSLNKKWAKRPTLKLLYSKYVWGNRQKVWLWNLKRK